MAGNDGGFGTAFGVGVATLLDDVAVPAFGWGPSATETPPAIHAYGLASHVVFGAALEECGGSSRRWIEAGLSPLTQRHLGRRAPLCGD